MQGGHCSKWRGIFTEWKIKTCAGDVKPVGECESQEPLISCKIDDAGHSVAKEKPEAALNLVQNFIAKKPFDPHPTLSVLDMASAKRFPPKRRVTTSS